MTRGEWHVEHGDCLEVLSGAPESTFDAIVTDPPYLLDFMGKEWDGADGIAGRPEIWRECLRVLKPGGHLLAFGGTRTYHRMASAIETAGFEVRDSIHWIYGTGFPKSVDVAKAIDKAAGIWRGRAGAPTSENGSMSGKNYARTDKGEPATAEAAAWDGWGTALKPAHEPIIVARKPLVGTVAQNVLAHGTGAMNIDACRVGTAGGTRRDGKADEPNDAGWAGMRGHGVEELDAGRWPPNVLYSHAEGCVFVGKKRVKTATNNGSISRPGVNVYGNYAGDRPAFDYADADGMETVEAWKCADDCPVAELDRQSGQRASHKYEGPRGRRPGSSNLGNVGGTNNGDPFPNGPTYGDVGGASRFFPVFKYQPKPSKAERGEGNVHPTVKPIALMEWLVRLVAPPGGTVLDPFTGSGTTGVAAVRAGFNFVGIEREDAYVEIARSRIDGEAA